MLHIVQPLCSLFLTATLFDSLTSPPLPSPSFSSLQTFSFGLFIGHIVFNFFPLGKKPEERKRKGKKEKKKKGSTFYPICASLTDTVVGPIWEAGDWTFERTPKVSQANLLCVLLFFFSLLPFYELVAWLKSGCRNGLLRSGSWGT